MGIVLSEIGITIVTFNIKKSSFVENFGHLFDSPFKIVIFDNSTYALEISFFATHKAIYSSPYFPR